MVCLLLFCPDVYAKTHECEEERCAQSGTAPQIDGAAKGHNPDAARDYIRRR